MENRQCERKFRRVELVAQLRARQLEHAVEIVRRLAVDVHQGAQDVQVVGDGVVANHLNAVLADGGFDVKLRRDSRLGARRGDLFVVGVQAGENIDAARVELLEVVLDLVVGVDDDVHAVQELYAVLDVRIRDEIVLVARDGDLRFDVVGNDFLVVRGGMRAVRRLTAISDHDERVDDWQADGLLHWAADGGHDLDVASADGRVRLVVDVLHLLHQLLDVVLVRALDGDLVHLAVDLHLLVRLHQLLVGCQQALSAVCSALDIVFGQNAVEVESDAGDVSAESVLEAVLRALIAGADGQSGVDALGGMKRPVVNDLRVAVTVLLISDELHAIDEQLDLREVHGDGVMMPFVVADLRYLPAPFSRKENVQIAVIVVLAEQQNQAAVTNE